MLRGRGDTDPPCLTATGWSLRAGAALRPTGQGPFSRSFAAYQFHRLLGGDLLVPDHRTHHPPAPYALAAELASTRARATANLRGELGSSLYGVSAPCGSATPDGRSPWLSIWFPPDRAARRSMFAERAVARPGPAQFSRAPGRGLARPTGRRLPRGSGLAVRRRARESNSGHKLSQAWSRRAEMA